MLSIDLIVRTAFCIFGSATVIRDFTPLNSCRWCSSTHLLTISNSLPYLEIPLLRIYFTWTGERLPFLPHQTIITNHIPFTTLSSPKLKTIWNQNLSPKATFYRPRNISPQGISPFFTLGCFCCDLWHRVNPPLSAFTIIVKTNSWF